MTRHHYSIIKDFPIAALLLDTGNPRIRAGQDQKDCITRILRDKLHFINLLRNIAQEGLSPENILVSGTPDGDLIVRDGNRRVAALKLLNDPSLCEDEALKKQIIEAKHKHGDRIPSHIDVLRCDNEAIMLKHLELKHTGENQGVGQRDWNSLLKTLFHIQHGKPDQHKRAAQLLLWLEKHDYAIPDNFEISTLTRILNSESLKLLGFRVKSDELIPILPELQAYELVVRVASDIIIGRINVKRGGEAGSVYERDAGRAYISKIREEIGPPLASISVSRPEAGSKNEPSSEQVNNGEKPTKSQPEAVELISPPEKLEYNGEKSLLNEKLKQNNGEETDGFSLTNPQMPEQKPKEIPESPVTEISNDNAQNSNHVEVQNKRQEPSLNATEFSDSNSNKSTKPRGNVKAPWDRERLMGAEGLGFAIPRTETKAQMIVAELKKLNVKETPLAGTMLLRAFIECSDRYYRKKHAKDKVGSDTNSLRKNVSAIIHHMDRNNFIEKSLFDTVSRYTVDNRVETLHFETLQKNLHRNEYHPNYQTLNTFWDDLKGFFEKCWTV